ncbi:MAG: hypothetical protein J6562_05555 [Candidatus Schmidhempelia sp.]|nr:hypothetical protein [Candidatus Schmidhempelia sp.]
MIRIVWLMISSIMLVGDIPNRIINIEAHDIPKINNEVCYYDKLLGDEFDFSGHSEAEFNKDNYISLFLEPNLNGLKLFNRDKINHHGRLTNTIFYSHNKTFRKVILDTCQPVYIAVKRTDPLQREQIKKLGIDFISAESRLNNIKNNLERFINKSIYIKAPLGFVYLDDEHGIKQKIHHGTKLFVHEVIIDPNLDVVYMIVKYGNNYLKIAYNNDYYSSKPTLFVLKRDLWNNYHVFYFFFILLKYKLSDFISLQKNNNNQFMSFYFSVYNNIIMFSNDNKDHILM